MSSGDRTERSRGMMNTKGCGELGIALDVVGPLRPRRSPLAIAIARLENQYVFANPRVHKHRAGEHGAAVPTAATVAVKFKIAFLETECTDQFPDHLTFRLAVVERYDSIDVLNVKSGIGDGL